MTLPAGCLLKPGVSSKFLSELCQPHRWVIHREVTEGHLSGYPDCPAVLSWSFCGPYGGLRTACSFLGLLLCLCPCLSWLCDHHYYYLYHLHHCLRLRLCPRPRPRPHPVFTTWSLVLGGVLTLSPPLPMHFMPVAAHGCAVPTVFQAFVQSFQKPSEKYIGVSMFNV